MPLGRPGFRPEPAGAALRDGLAVPMFAATMRPIVGLPTRFRIQVGVLKRTVAMRPQHAAVWRVRARDACDGARTIVSL